MSEKQQKKFALISGAPGSIGQALCVKFAAQGYTIVALDRDRAGLDKLVDKFDREKRGPLIPVLCDLGEPDNVKTAIDAVETRHGPITALVNNAAYITETGNLKDMTPEKWETEITVNLNGVYNLTSAVLPHMVQRKAGSVIIISSVNALFACGHPAYSAAKAGVISYGKSVAMEYGPCGIRSNVILPGTVATKAWQKRAEINPEIFTILKKWYPLGRIATPEDVAEPVWFLSSPAAKAISGAILTVDAGLTAGNRLLAEDLTLQDFA